MIKAAFSTASHLCLALAAFAVFSAGVSWTFGLRRAARVSLILSLVLAVLGAYLES